MSGFTLYIGYRNTSSWSLRGWLMARKSGLPFHERQQLGEFFGHPGISRSLRRVLALPQPGSHAGRHRALQPVADGSEE